MESSRTFFAVAIGGVAVISVGMVALLAYKNRKRNTSTPIQVTEQTYYVLSLPVYIKYNYERNRLPIQATQRNGISELVP